MSRESKISAMMMNVDQRRVAVLPKELIEKINGKQKNVSEPIRRLSARNGKRQPLSSKLLGYLFHTHNIRGPFC